MTTWHSAIWLPISTLTMMATEKIVSDCKC